jgi:acetylornithine/N-succinyldiaminopimelate aminotransferase
MLGVECKTDCTEFVNLLLSNGVLANCTNSNVIRILPPLIIEEAHVDSFIAVLRGTYDEHFSRVPLKESAVAV